MKPSPGMQKTIVTIILKQHVINDLIHIVGKAAKLHAALAKMPELMCDNGLQFAYINAIDKAKTDLKIFANREEHTPEARVIKDTGIHVRRNKYLFWKTCFGFMAELSNERK